jgi:hypothetical protein
LLMVFGACAKSAKIWHKKANIAKHKPTRTNNTESAQT